MRINEKGRSMIEMLGVLAIIGVLSVGGIAGYSKAMAKFKVNKTIDQVAHTVANTRILFSSQRNYKDLGPCSTTPADEKAGHDLMADTKLLPDSLKGYANAYGGDFHLCAANRLGGTLTVGEGVTNADAAIGDARAFVLIFTGLPTEACVDLATQDWNAASGSGLIEMAVQGEAKAVGAGSMSLATFMTGTGCQRAEGTTPSTVPSADGGVAYACGDDTDPMQISVATKACKSTSAKPYSTIYFKFY